jgi:hypothetical protein
LANSEKLIVPDFRLLLQVPMTRLRKRIAERLKDSQNTSAMLTTFQEASSALFLHSNNSNG